MKLVWHSLVPVLVAVGCVIYIFVTHLGVLKLFPYQYTILPASTENLKPDVVKTIASDAWKAISPAPDDQERPLTNVIKGAAEPRIIWLRYEFNASAAKQSRVFSIPLMFVRSINFYIQEPDRQELRLALDGSDQSKWHDYFQPSLKIEIDEGKKATVYIQIQPTTFLKTALSIQDALDHQQHINNRNIFLSLVTGGSFFLILFGMALFISLRSNIYIYSVAFQMFISISMILAYGDIFGYLPWLATRTDLHQQALLQSSMTAILFFGLCLVELTKSIKQADKLRRRWSFEISMLLTLILVLPIIPGSFQPSIIVALLLLSMVEASLFLAKKPDASLNLQQIALMGSSFWSAFSLTIGAIIGSLTNSIYLENALVAGQYIVATMLVIEFSRRMQFLENERLQTISILRSDDGGSKSIGHSETNTTREHEEFDVTIMFIDIMSFSVIAEKFGAESVFFDLSQRLRHLTIIIESHGGTIDRSLGDGLLCFFSAGTTDHTLRAFEAAIKIHDSIARDAKQIGLNQSRRALMPVRIGIHTDRVVIGNLVGAYQIDFTMVGNGVNFASNLEQACSPFQIVVSQEAHRKLTADRYPAHEFQPINIAVKHRQQLFPAYRYNPFTSRQNAVREGLNLHFEQLGVVNREHRFQPKYPGSISLVSAHGIHDVLDFSLQGFRASSTVILGQNAIIEAEFDIKDPVVARNLRERHLLALTLEVRWSQLDGERIEQGFKIIGSNEEQSHFRIAQLLSIVTTKDKAA